MTNLKKEKNGQQQKPQGKKAGQTKREVHVSQTEERKSRIESGKTLARFETQSLPGKNPQALTN